MSGPVLSVRGLRVIGPGGEALVDGVDLDLRAGEIVGLVGESGAGKSLTALSLLGLVPLPAHAAGGEVVLEGERLDAMRPAGLARVRGARIGLVPQDPAAALDPVRRVGAQIAETLRAHAPMGRAEAARRAAEALAEVGVVRDDHPHRLSGGQRQRAMIAMALAPGPAVLIADEPTASVDPAVRMAILDLIAIRAREAGLAVLLISHDLGAVARVAGRVLVMDGGRIVEEGPPSLLSRAARHPRTVRLAAAAALAPPATAPRVQGARERPVLEARDLSCELRGRSGARVRVVDGVSLAIAPGETLGLVGASGSGKTTLARSLVGLVPPSGGALLVDGADPARTVQIVFQDPYLSLDPRLSVAASIVEPLAIHRVGGASRADRRAHRARRSGELLAAVGLHPQIGARRPAQLSGGERQRVAIARALALEPRLLVLDEPISSLDPSIGARIMDLLAGLRAERGLSYLLISHDLAAVASAADRVAVMDAGRIVEEGPSARVLAAPVHPRTVELVEAAQALSLVPWAWPGSTTQA